MQHLCLVTKMTHQHGFQSETNNFLVFVLFYRQISEQARDWDSERDWDRQKKKHIDTAYNRHIVQCQLYHALTSIKFDVMFTDRKSQMFPITFLFSLYFAFYFAMEINFYFIATKCTSRQTVCSFHFGFLYYTYIRSLLLSLWISIILGAFTVCRQSLMAIN